MLVLMKVLQPGEFDELHGAVASGWRRRAWLASFPECPCCLACFGVALGLIQRPQYRPLRGRQRRG